MNFYKITGRVTAQCSFFLKTIGFKNIKSFAEWSGNKITIETTKGQAEIKFLNPGVKGVYWSVLDVKQCAIDRWELYQDDYPNAICWEDVYDEEEFESVLEAVIDKHDASVGINWETINYWLDEIALIKQDEENTE